jgi:hypothetical protein
MNNILQIPFATFSKDWKVLQKFLSRRGNPPFEITDDLDLSNNEMESLGNLTSVEGNLDLSFSKVKSLGNLSFIGGDLDIRNKPLAISFSEEEIHEKVQVKGSIILY